MLRITALFTSSNVGRIGRGASGGGGGGGKSAGRRGMTVKVKKSSSSKKTWIIDPANFNYSAQPLTELPPRLCHGLDSVLFKYSSLPLPPYKAL